LHLQLFLPPGLLAGLAQDAVRLEKIRRAGSDLPLAIFIELGAILGPPCPATYGFSPSGITIPRPSGK
jgi:hypothetical protein